jgi:hypothetical protein
MNIKSAKYIKSSYANENACINVVLKDAPANTFMSVPLDPANRHYQEIQEWVAEGNKIEDAD